jgi:NADPH-dependent ferric siderophore reductase
MEPLPVRLVEVTQVDRITPRMARVTFGGTSLAHDEPDQQVKLYFPKPGQTAPVLPEPGEDFLGWYQEFTALPESVRPWMRSYTLRVQDPVTVDFVLHDNPGPATRWALAARPGDTLGMFGPSVTFARPVPLSKSIGGADWLLMAGDATALPAIGTLVESLPPDARAVAYIESDERQQLSSRGTLAVHWVPRGSLLEAVRGAEFPAGSVFAWLAGEASVVRALRRHLVDERQVPKRSIDFAGYWRAELSQDDAPTEEDLADARELQAASAVFDQLYTTHTAPWEIGGPQPAIVALEREGRIRGAVLDAGCGTGEHTIHLTGLGYDVLGVDFSAKAVELARAKAPAARFDVADALDLGSEPTYDTVVDSALFHVFGPDDRTRYVRSLHRICRPGGLVHVLALSDKGPGYGPAISDTAIRDAFGEGWVLEDLRPSEYRGVLGAAGEQGDLPAWLARVRKV